MLAEGLARISVEGTTSAMQVSSTNPMVGIDGRTSLLQNLSAVLKANPTFFGPDARPGGLVGKHYHLSTELILKSLASDFLGSQSVADGPTQRVPVAALWGALQEALAPIWPARFNLGGVPLGDVWPCDALKAGATNDSDFLVPFHKLTGWITYSLLEPLEKVLGWKFEGVEDMTGLPEYRNGEYTYLWTSYVT